MKKLLLAILTVLCAMCCFAFVGCDDTNNANKDDIYEVYRTYVAYAEEKGEQPLSYEDWLQTIKGEKGEKGDKGDKGEDGTDGITPTIEISNDGYWVINGEKTEYKAIGKDGEDGADGIDGTDGENGIGIKSIEFDSQGKLVITLTDDTKLPAIEMPQKQEHTHTCEKWVRYGTENECQGSMYYSICQDCNYIEWRKGSDLDHVYPTHYSSDYADKTNHYHHCINCGKLAEEGEEHTLNALGVCTECGYQYISEGLTYSEYNNGYQVDSIGTCIDTILFIPKTYNNKPVLYIGDNAFENCTGLTSVVIPDSVTSIGKNVFSGCTDLANVTIGSSVTSIGDSAFA